MAHLVFQAKPYHSRHSYHMVPKLKVKTILTQRQIDLPWQEKILMSNIINRAIALFKQVQQP